MAVDSVSPTVFVISENGGISSWFNCSDYMMEPSDITVSGTNPWIDYNLLLLFPFHLHLLEDLHELSRARILCL